MLTALTLAIFRADFCVSGLGGDGRPWHIGAEVYGDRDFLRAGFTIEEIFNLTKIDRWFLVQIKEIVDFEEELAGAKNLNETTSCSRASVPAE